MDNDEQLPTEAASKVVTEPVVDAAEVPEGTEGNPTEAEQGASPTPTDEEISESKKRRERRKAYVKELESKKADQDARLARIKNAGYADQAPNEEEFDDLTEYAAAKAVWSMSQKATEREASVIREEREQLDQHRGREIEANWMDAQAEARTRLQNFDQVISNPSTVITEQMAEMIKLSDAGPDIAYHLGSNPALSMQIASLSEREQAYELGRLTASVTAPRPIIQSNAPNPINPVGAPAKAQRDPSKMSIDDYRKWREDGGGR
jgi:hypothetical protein